MDESLEKRLRNPKPGRKTRTPRKQTADTRKEQVMNAAQLPDDLIGSGGVSSWDLGKEPLRLRNDFVLS